jgi:hypothetical protein
MCKSGESKPPRSLTSDPPGTEVTFLGRVVSADDYREICLNLTEFIKLLRKWNEEANSK